MTTEIILLCIAAFTAGFIDAIVGGGGLIQTPAGLVILPLQPMSTVIGTLKIPAFSGTSIAAIQYARKIKVEWQMFMLMAPLALASAWCGSLLLTKVSNVFMKPILLVGVFVYTYFNKRFGIHAEKAHSRRRKFLYCVLISMLIGFYDGFIGPGTGTFLVLIFIGLVGFDFLRASAHAKFINLATKPLFNTSVHRHRPNHLADCHSHGGVQCSRRIIRSTSCHFERQWFYPDLFPVGDIRNHPALCI